MEFAMGYLQLVTLVCHVFAFWMVSKKINNVTQPASMGLFFVKKLNLIFVICLIFILFEQALSKELWRAGFLTCPTSCTMDMPWQDCQCQCDAGKIGNLSPAEVMAISEVLDAVTYYDSTGELIEAFEDEDVRDIAPFSSPPGFASVGSPCSFVFLFLSYVFCFVSFRLFSLFEVQI